MRLAAMKEGLSFGELSSFFMEKGKFLTMGVTESFLDETFYLNVLT